MTHPFRATVALVAGLVAYGSVAQAQGEPPGRVGRLAFMEGSVSFHDQDDLAWTLFQWQGSRPWGGLCDDVT